MYKWRYIYKKLYIIVAILTMSMNSASDHTYIIYSNTQMCNQGTKYFNNPLSHVDVSWNWLHYESTFSAYLCVCVCVCARACVCVRKSDVQCQWNECLLGWEQSPHDWYTINTEKKHCVRKRTYCTTASLQPIIYQTSTIWILKCLIWKRKPSSITFITYGNAHH